MDSFYCVYDIGTYILGLSRRVLLESVLAESDPLLWCANLRSRHSDSLVSCNPSGNTRPQDSSHLAAGLSLSYIFKLLEVLIRIRAYECGLI